MSDSPLSIRARRKYKAQIEQQARESYVAKFNKRMDLAKQGVMAVKKRDLRSALQYFHSYIEVLQQAKGVQDLLPKSFDPKSDSAEMLMLTGVYWDLAKIYDKTKDKNKLKFFVDKFVIFSKGTSYQKLSLEMVRKFLTNENPTNRAVFKEAYVRLGGGKCFIATSVEEYCDPLEITTLKKFRDQILAKSLIGRVFTSAYYRVGPVIAISIIRSSEKNQKRVAKLIGSIANAISFRFFPDGM